MKRTEKLTGVPAALKDQVVKDYESEGAKVTVTKTGSSYTITAEFPDSPAPAAGEGLLHTIRGAAESSGLAPGEDERLARAELASDDSSGPALYYPAATRDLLGSMKTIGTYARGYPLGAVVHYTAGRDDPRNDIRHALAQGYCFFVIAPDGGVYQNFPLNRWGSHAGVSRWPNLGSGVSQHLVGIEICCAGKLRDLGGGRYRAWYNEESFLAKSGRKPDPAADFSSDRVREVKKQQNRAAGYYLKFTEMQEAALHTLLSWMKSNNPKVFSFDLVLGHDEVSPGRKVDPGGSLSTTMPELRETMKQGW